MRCIVLLVLCCQITFAQSVGIGTSTPDPSARLQINSSSQGILVPKLTAAQRAGITNPATGLLVFQTDGTQGFYYYAGGGWINLTNGVQANNLGIAVSSSYGVTTTLAGTGESGDVDGAGAQARFGVTVGIAVDALGNVYVVDKSYHKIKKITSSGVVSTYAGSGQGNEDGPRLSAKFTRPSAVAIDAGGNLYVADEYNHKIRKIQADGEVITLAGNGIPDSTNGQGASASFWLPSGVAVDAAGNVYVADTRNNKVRRITPGGMVSTYAGSGAEGSNDGIGGEATFSGPSGVAVDIFGNVYVADKINNKIRKITPDRMVTTVAGTGDAGSNDGPAAAATFSLPAGVAVDAFGNIYVADENSNKIRKISPAGMVSTLAGSGLASAEDDTGAAASFAGPTDVAVDASGNVYVADAGNNKVRKIIAR